MRCEGRLRRVPGHIESLYLGGDSVVSLARQFNCSQGTIRRILRAANISLRGWSEAGRTRWDRNPDSASLEGLAKGRLSRTGVPLPAQSLERRALAHQRSRQNRIGRGEKALERYLRELGHNPTPQLAVGKYNIDLALRPLAIEVHTDSHHPIRRGRLLKRTEYLESLGWIVCFVWLSSKQIVTRTTARRLDGFYHLISGLGSHPGTQVFRGERV